MRFLRFLALIAIASCAEQNAAPSKYPELQKMAWLEGRWLVHEQAQAAGPVPAPDRIVESWTRESDSVLVATSWIYHGSDSVLGERMRLEEKGGRLKFIATVPSQNGGAPVDFVRSDSGAATTFINDKHDFPQRIHYRPVGTDSAFAEISGQTAQGPLRITYGMKRMK